MRRQRGQTILIAALSMVAVVGGLAIAVDAGIFFVVQRQLQTAADAGALAGAWHTPVCPAAYAAQGCLTSPATPPMSGTPPSASCDGTSGYAACDVASANANTIRQLCGGTTHVTVSTGTTLIRPAQVNTIVVTASCTAGYTFGRILNLTSKTITASAAAALGNRDATNAPTCVNTPWLSNGGDMTDFTVSPPAGRPFCGFIARLIH